jgi:metallo-beta-lactamase class B
LIYVAGDQAVLIDTPVSDSLTMKLIGWFTEQGVKIIAAIPTHWHDDCLGGLSAVHALGIKSYGYRLTIELAAKHDYTAPQIGFDDSLSLVLNGHDIAFKFMGPGHTTDNIIAWIIDEKILFGGCMVKALSARGIGNTVDADIEAWSHTIENLINTYSDVLKVVPGHGAAGGPELLDYTLLLLKSQ